MQKKELNREYIRCEFEKLKNTDFVSTIEALSPKLLAGEGVFSFLCLTGAEKQMMDEILYTGNFGRFENVVQAHYREFVAATDKRT